MGLSVNRNMALTLLVGVLAILGYLIWLVTSGPAGLRSDAYYGARAAKTYQAWLRGHGHPDATVRACFPVRTGLEIYVAPSSYSCTVRSTTRCILIYDGVDDFGAMTRSRCSYLVND